MDPPFLSQTHPFVRRATRNGFILEEHNILYPERNERVSRLKERRSSSWTHYNDKSIIEQKVICMHTIYTAIKASPRMKYTATR
ncbi:hypothetical protein WN55_05009 [Dufourea novaeangliae]|uniref:Uncharacterized protein n=1 Tax=Dufourea novaeangliae TaxID=178035 RepID=A0A154PQD1_DUFNO|nr:hypothetical protein WN55_05009 [Dufourea novaeangliae]